MKTRIVYEVLSLNEDLTMIFGSLKRAKKWVENFDPKFNVIFDKSTKEDLHIQSRILF